MVDVSRGNGGLQLRILERALELILHQSNQRVVSRDRVPGLSWTQSRPAYHAESLVSSVVSEWYQKGPRQYPRVFYIQNTRLRQAESKEPTSGLEPLT